MTDCPVRSPHGDTWATEDLVWPRPSGPLYVSTVMALSPFVEDSEGGVSPESLLFLPNPP